MTKVYVTEEGLENLKNKMKQLVSQRPEISQQIAEARDKGDLSENAEYDAAKEAQGMLEMRIAQIQEQIRNVRIIDKSKLNSDMVNIMNIVKMKNLKNNKILQYTLVPENEANIKQGKISIKTPIAKGLLGKKVGDKTKIKVPSGIMEFEILDISL